MMNTQATQQTAPATAARPNAELRDQIKQSILAAQDAAREAAVQQTINNATANAPPGTKTIRVFDGQTDNVYGGQGPARVVYSGADGRGSGQDFPPQVVDISIAFFVMCAVMVIGWPLARAFGKRLERRGDVPAVAAGTSEQLKRIEQAVEAMSIEVERISESQRFMAKLQNAAAPSRELTSS